MDGNATFRPLTSSNLGNNGLDDGGCLSPEEFKQFRHESVHALSDLNDRCDERFRITSWPRWDYDLNAGKLVFSEEGTPKVIASVQVVGTTSTASNTWLWGWANENFPGSVTARICEVRAFGEREGLPQLTKPALPDDEYLGWEMTAIAARVIGAKGGYRCPYDSGFTYLVYTDLNFADSGADAQPLPAPSHGAVDCELHGLGRPTYVCEHLVAEPKQEWFCDLPTAANPWPDAWCARCDEVYQERGEWNEKNEGRIRIKLLCHRCYESLRRQDPTIQ